MRHAKQLGVSVVHLNLVIKGERTSEDLLNRYRALLAEEEAINSLKAELGLLDSTLARAADLRAREAAANGVPAKAALRAEIAALATPELRAAIVRIGPRLALSKMHEVLTVFDGPQTDFLLGICREPRRKGVAAAELSR